MTGATLGWLGIVRLGLVQTALGAIVVLTTSTLNRVMVVELLLPAMLPGALVTVHHVIQMARPRWGYGSDVGGRRTPWILGGMVLLALGAVTASLATAWMGTSRGGGIALAVLGFVVIGIGAGAAGTSVLALLASRVTETRRAAAAATVWIMMIAGFVVTATVAGSLLDPYSPARLVAVTAGVAAAAVLLTVLAVAGVERRARPAADAAAGAKPAFREALAEVWAEPDARRFTVFVFVSMLAYSMQDLILEPFAGIAYGFTPGESTKLAGLQHAGVLLGMVSVALVASALGGSRQRFLRTCTIGGCVASATALTGLMLAGHLAPLWPLKPNVFLLGLTNGIFAVAAIASMMALAGRGRESREGLRMGLWGAAQAIAFALGGFLGTVAVDALRHLSGSAVAAYATVFAVEGALFLVAAVLATRVARPAPAATSVPGIRLAPEASGG